MKRSSALLIAGLFLAIGFSIHPANAGSESPRSVVFPLLLGVGY